MARVGLFLICSRTVSLKSRERAAIQSLIAPTPGKTILSACFNCSLSEDIITLSESATDSRALPTECKLPIP